MHAKRYVLTLTATVILLGAALAFGLIPRLSHQRALLAASTEERERLPVVSVVPVKRSAVNAQSVLPGSIEAIYETPIYARADGYLRSLLVDIGDRVKKDQELAVIESPEIDQQLRQARASLAQTQASLIQAQAVRAQAQANLVLAKVTLDRWKQLVDRGVTSRQDGDEKQAVYDTRVADLAAAEASVNVAQSNIAANEANVQRLVEMKAFDKVTAPFDGVITVRNTNPGTLISAGTNSPNRELLRMAEIDVLRIFVNVPQATEASIQPGMIADVTVQELPKRIFHGRVSRTANSLDPTSRTLRVEVQVKNNDLALLPGMYAQVNFSFARLNPPLLIPGDTVVIRAAGPEVGIVGPDHKVHYQKIEVGHDYGNDVEVLSGLRAGQLLIVNPTDEAHEGVKVSPQAQARTTR